jgi:3-deoxy-D-manno-octulosonic-acid transferase
VKILLILYNLLLFALLPIIFPLGYLIALRRKEEIWYFERLGFILFDKKPEKTIWIHCASVGEVLSVKPLVDHLKNELPDFEIAVSTITASGKSVAMKNLSAGYFFLLPIENYFAIKYLVSYLNTEYFIIVDTELWPNMIYAAAQNSKLILVNARISEKSYKKYLLFRPIFKNLLTRFEHIFAKSADDAARFEAIIGNTAKISNIGNIKASIDTCTAPINLNGNFFLAASTHKGEEEIIKNAFKKVADRFAHLVVAPRHLNRVDEVVNLFSTDFETSKYSENKLTKVIIIDSFGILKNFYSKAEKIFVGGSIVNIGGHNIYEALIFSKVVAAGKNMQNFQEIYEIATKYNVLTTIENEKDLVEYLMTDTYKEADFENFLVETRKMAEKPLKEITDFIKNESVN